MRDEGRQAIGRLAAIVESAHEAIFSESLDGTILTWNRGAASLYGFTAEEAIGMDAVALAPPHSREVTASFREYARNGTAVPRHETSLLTKGGVLVDVALTISPILDEDGAVVAISTIARDLTEHRWLAETLNQTLGRLEKALAEAREAEERSRRFLADAAHQLRSPISGVSACAETLLLGVDDHQREELLAGLLSEASRASRLIGSLLRLARLDQGEAQAAGPADLVAIYERELDRIRLFAPHLSVALEVVGHLEVPVHVDREAVREALGNLLDNARRHAVSAIVVTVTRAAGDVTLRVENDGPPVPEPLAERIFERFVSLDGNGGSGLGLSIAQELARAQGGDLVYAAGGFVMTLPVRTGATGVTA